ncbi:YHS domain-containing protein [Caldifermentibacillus hisashii]|uniref:YHS domain-containing protein n=1 Tax=Caldifermentibacillus hisashii TaxID=996558 RepID=UPI0030E826A5
MNLKVKDPVCGMTVEVNESPFQLNYKGKDYYFCAASCLKEFKENPEKYLSNIDNENQEESNSECCHNHSERQEESNGGCCHNNYLEGHHQCGCGSEDSHDHHCHNHSR